MSLFDRALEKERSSLGFKSLRKVKAVADHQNGKSVRVRDIVRKALPPSKRISASGKVYYEYRKNRTDMRGERI